MFEKEAEEAIMKKYPSSVQGYKSLVKNWQEGAEFGYNFAKEEIDYLNKHWRSEEERKANEWHFVKDVTCYEDLPQEEDSKNKLFMWKVKIHNDRGSVEFNGWHSGNYGDLIYEINAYQVYCYKEIVPPKETESDKDHD